ncbi:hypothetical protein GCM10011519_29850 [Marmoricola endophyticus]|uniref:Amine oxidase domain-containing protein n=1 Tax=Marmoricola endophyticus TaxID=2040280 RepID=A0A917BRR1_9ACTN|nr:FAD-dependent oxidoreductase [Marmoricola endophyticus]GGF53972.1 hypothetical protein GCM10011519_29850 [Marmoricola endophyticus]
MTRRVAVVGSGVSGLVAGWVLSRDPSTHVTLYEADDRLGGHADTHEVAVGGGRTVPIDTGFIVHNERTYPTLLRLFDELGVTTQESDMSMSVSDPRSLGGSGLEWAGALGTDGLFPDPANLRNPRYLRMLVEIPRFHRMAKRLLASPEGTAADEETLDSFLTRGRFTDFFRTYFMTPLVSAVWSTDPDHALAYPARYLFRFLEHHGMLTVFGSPTWRTVTGGSREYVDRVAKAFDEVLLSTPVSGVREVEDGVEVTAAGETTTYDAVVVATHSEQALAVLEGAPGGASALQREVLGAMHYEPNVAQLHTDTSLMPVARKAWASWNYQCRGGVGRAAGADSSVVVTYDLSRLMRVPAIPGDERRFLVTLNAEELVDPATVIATRHYAHPIYDPSSVAAQRRLPELSTDRLAFAGAYHGWGFHEDGALSGRTAAERVGGVWSTPDREEHPRPTTTPRLYETSIGHTRTAPLRNQFRYRSHTWLVDVDDLPRYSGAFGPLLRRLSQFRSADHVGDPRHSIRENIEAVLTDHGVEMPSRADGGRILMLAHARTLGYVFNPISVFWCHRADHSLAAVVVEVHNTYGGRHAYVVHPDERGNARVAKELYVSPFNDTSGEYAVSVPVPGDELSVTVTLHREDQPPFVATMRGTAAKADTRGVLRASLRHPLVPLLGAARIRVQGVMLWLRGLSVQPRPSGHETDLTHHRTTRRHDR